MEEGHQIGNCREEGLVAVVGSKDQSVREGSGREAESVANQEQPGGNEEYSD